MLTDITPGLLRPDKNVRGQIFSIKNIYLYRFCLYMIRNALTVFVYVKYSLKVVCDDHAKEICHIILAQFTATKTYMNTYLQKYFCWREHRFSRRSPRASYLIESSAFRPSAVCHLSWSLLYGLIFQEACICILDCVASKYRYRGNTRKE